MQKEGNRMILTTTEESRAIDQEAMAVYGLPEAVLMENAGAAVVRLSGERLHWYGASSVVVCGTGNNGGDGFVIARYAAEAGAEVTVLVMGNPEHMGASARRYRQVAETMGIPVIELTFAKDAMPYLGEADIVVDALIGTGLAKEVTGEKAALISLINDAEAAVVSVDVPSGMDSDTGKAMGAVVEADLTVALGSIKRGHELYPGSDYVGTLLYAPIGIPDKAREDYPVRLTQASDVRARLPLRSRISHKGKNGFIGIFAGSAGMAGAGLLCAQGALYGGSGKVALSSVNDIAWELAGKVPEVMVHAMGDGPCFSEKMLKTALEEAKSYDVVALGCGFGRSEETQHFTEELLCRLHKTVVVDADALFAIAELPISLKDAPGELILTPHVGEFSRLTGLSAQEIEDRRIDAAREYAQKQGVVLVLKGAPTVTALPDGRAWVNPTGNPGMAAGGMGDTLTGIIAALAGQGMNAGDAALCGVYLHGLSGDILAEKMPVGYTASDVAKTVGLARTRIQQGQ